MDKSDAIEQRQMAMRKAWATIGWSIVVIAISWPVLSWPPALSAVPLLGRIHVMDSDPSGTIYWIAIAVVAGGCIGVLVGAFRLLKNYFS